MPRRQVGILSRHHSSASSHGGVVDSATSTPNSSTHRRKLVDAILHNQHQGHIVSRNNSCVSDESAIEGTQSTQTPTFVEYSCARDIVFRDQIRRASVGNEHELSPKRSDASDHIHLMPHDRHELFIKPKIIPLPQLELGPNEEFQSLLDQDPCTQTLDYTDAEQDVVERLRNQTAVVKTLKNSEWATFLQRFLRGNNSKTATLRSNPHHQDQTHNGSHFNSFMTSTSLLPENGMKMRCYGSTTQYTVGVVFPLPNHYNDPKQEDEEVQTSETWAWPAGYAAKTEYNIDERGRLINGRKEALVPISTLRQYNDDYLHKKEYVVANKVISDQSVIPYNEIYLRVGGRGRVVNGFDVASKEPQRLSFETGVGLPIALFVRSATYGHLISLMRARARLMHVLGGDHFRGIPLLLMTPADGIRVLTDALQSELWKVASRSLNPFQDPHISHKTTGPNIDATFVEEKMTELLDLDKTISDKLTPQELARLAGGFGATDESVKKLLTEVLEKEKNTSSNGHESATTKLQDVVNEGLAYAVRSGDYHTARQLLVLYSVVSAQTNATADGADEEQSKERERRLVRSPDLSKAALMEGITAPPPPPLDTDRLRSATNSDGLLAVLGAAQILRVMKDGTAKRRVKEVISALDEWVEHGQHSVAFRIASWQNQRAAQGDLKIAVACNPHFMAFAGKKALANRKTFAQRLKRAAESTDFSGSRFLMAISQILDTMHSPCLRLELLQYVLGLDNRYSVAHVARSIELAATCLATAM